MSIRYKFILALLSMTGVCLGVYIWIAKSVFEKDKEVAIFESAGQTSSAQAATLRQHFEESINFASMLSSTLSGDYQTFSAAGSTLFANKKDLQALGVWQEGRFLTWQTKDPELTAKNLITQLNDQKSRLILLKPTGLIALSVNIKPTATTPARQLVLVLDLNEQLKFWNYSMSEGGSFLANGNEPLSSQSDFPFEMAKNFLASVPAQKNMGEQTSIEKVGSESYLLSSKEVKFGDLRILTVIPKAAAFGGLDLLYVKSMQFFGLIIFIVLLVSVLMTHTLLRHLVQLTAATKEIAQGHFNLKLGVESKDEFGTLAFSFETMSQEIKRLLTETKEKARMTAELRTAQTVQENLFPLQSMTAPRFEIHGLYRSASECGGDWWYHFEHETGTYIFICDATGHGAPAALITAAAKAAVNLMKRDPALNLKKLTEAFNYALYETAKGNLLMTGFVLHIKNDSTIEYVNASHEPPLLLKDSEIDYLIDPIGPRFGQDPVCNYETASIPMPDHDQMILLYTDGITSQHNKDERELGGRKFTKHLKSLDLKTVPLEQLNTSVFTLVDQHRGDVIQEDDLTVVTLRFRKAA